MYVFWGVSGVNWAIGAAFQTAQNGLMAVARQPVFVLFNFMIGLTAIVAKLWLGIGIAWACSRSPVMSRCLLMSSSQVDVLCGR